MKPLKFLASVSYFSILPASKLLSSHGCIISAGIRVSKTAEILQRCASTDIYCFYCIFLFGCLTNLTELD